MGCHRRPRANHRIGLPRLLPHQRRLFYSRALRRLLIAGVGTGKTHGAMYLALRAAIEQPGINGALFAPTYRLFQRVDLPSWRQIVPGGLYTFRAGEQLIRMRNGTDIFCMGTDRASERVVGLNLGWAIMDEAAVARDPRIPRLVMQRIRTGDPKKRFLALVTSPHGYMWIKDWSEMADARGRQLVDVIRATTYENPFLSPEYIAALEADYPPGTPEHQQEMLGHIVALVGLVYGQLFTRSSHITDFRYRFDRPYELGWDPGSRASGVVAMQEKDPGVWVVVREWIMDNEFTEDTARKIWFDMGEKEPIRICLDTPSKLNTRTGIGDLKALRSVFSSAKVKVIAGRKRVLRYRRRAVSSALRSRRLLISADIVPARLRPAERGLVHALETLEWAEQSSRSELVDEKDQKKHITDALEFWVTDRIPPRFCDSEDRMNAQEGMVA